MTTEETTEEQQRNIEAVAFAALSKHYPDGFVELVCMPEETATGEREVHVLVDFELLAIGRGKNQYLATLNVMSIVGIRV